GLPKLIRKYACAIERCTQTGSRWVLRNRDEYRTYAQRRFGMRKTVIVVATAVLAVGSTSLSTSASAFGLVPLGGFGLIHPGFGLAHPGGGFGFAHPGEGYGLGHFDGSFGGHRFGGSPYHGGYGHGGEPFYRGYAYRAAPLYGGYDYGGQYYYGGQAYYG